MFWRERDRENKEQNGGPPVGQVRVLVVGDSGVGKTSLVHLIMKGSSIARPPQTVGCTVDVKHTTYGNSASSSSSIRGDTERDFFVELWDISGHERYKDCRSLFYSQINGVMFVHDLSQRRAKTSLQKWAAEIAATGTFSAPLANGGPGGLPVPYIVIGNKADIASKEGTRGSSGNLVDVAHQWVEVEKQGLLPSSEEIPLTESFYSGGGLLAVVNVGMAIFLSTIFLTFLHPAIVSPSFASIQSAAKTGAPALVRSELLSSAWTGFFAGCLHTLSGPDHLAALAPLSIGRTRMESAAVGALWGCGHDAGQLLFGLIFLLLKDRLHIEVIRIWGTRVVGFTLLVIGAMGIREASGVPVPCVALDENGECDVTEYETLMGPGSGPSVGKKKIGFATFATGIVHGLQPDALMMILPALALPSRLAGAAFLVMFLVGTVMAMGSYTVFIGSCSQALKERVPRITEKLTWASSLIAIALGLALLVSQYFGFSLY